MKKTILIIAVMFIAAGTIFVSCDSGSKAGFDGFNSTSDGLYYKFHVDNSDTVFPVTGDYITIDMIYATEDTVIFDSKELPQVMKLPMVEPSYKGDIYDGISLMNIGDSATFICNADSVFLKLFRMPSVPPEFDSVDNIYFHIKLNAIETLEEVQAAQEAELKILKNEESSKRYAFLEDKYPDAQPVASGLYYIEVKEGKGSSPEAGKTVSVNYKGMFLDGTVFDSSFDRNQPIEFVLGQGQVIKGWDEGIAMMREGGSAILVIPSDLAYGPQGRSSIPPFSTLVFEVELLEIK